MIVAGQVSVKREVRSVSVLKCYDGSVRHGIVPQQNHVLLATQLFLPLCSTSSNIPSFKPINFLSFAVRAARKQPIISFRYSGIISEISYLLSPDDARTCLRRASARGLDERQGEFLRA